MSGQTSGGPIAGQSRAAAGSLLTQLQRLAGQSAVYGSADVFTNVISFFLIPIYTSYLTTADYGALGILALFSAGSKVIFRLGLESAFFRLHYDQRTDAERRQLAGTVLLFAALMGTLLCGFVVLTAPWITRLLFHGQSPPTAWVVLTALDIYLGVLAFVPLILLRIQNRPGLFSAFSIARHTLNIALKVRWVTQGWGVVGVLGSDMVATAFYSAILTPQLVRHVSLGFSPSMLRELLAFGLPRVPHGLMIQAQNLADRWILDRYVSLEQVGLYQIGYTFGTAIKFALSAFEPAWQPFVYSQVKSPQAPRTLARIVTFAAAGFVGIGLAIAVLSRELVCVMTRGSFHAAATIVPIVTLAYVLQGAFLLTSIGIGIEKKARYYPMVTLAAALTNISANFILIPRWGMEGAAWATVLSYAVMAALGYHFSRRCYPLPLEKGRLARLVGAALLVYLFACLVRPVDPQDDAWLTRLSAAVPGLAIKLLLLTAYPALLVAGGFLRPEEWAWLKRMWSRAWGRP